MKNKINFKKIGLFILANIIAISACLSFTLSTAYATTASIYYSAHVADIGWLGYVSNGSTAGTTGQGRQMEAISIWLPGTNGTVKVRTHIQNIGWTSWTSCGSSSGTSGTTGRGLRMEAIQIQLMGELAKSYYITYRTHIQDIGWTNWVINGEISGTTGQGLRMEAIQIKLVKKTTLYTKPQIQTITLTDLSRYLPLKCYTISTGNNTVVYGSNSTSSGQIGTIYGTDLITIKSASGDWIKVEYPISGGRTKTGWIQKNKVINSNTIISSYNATYNMNVYRRCGGGNTIGQIYSGDKVIEIYKQSGYSQVIYPLSNGSGYKMGWIRT